MDDQELDPALQIGQETANYLIAAATNLGPDNRGDIGPDDPEQARNLMRESRLPEYHGRPSNVSRCVDGREIATKLDLSDGEVDPQVAGSYAVSFTAVQFMMATNPGTLSQLTAETMDRLTAAGKQAVVHGRCGANANMQQALEFIGDHQTELAPVVMDVAQMLGLQDLVTTQDIGDLFTAAHVNAANDELWDISSDENVQVAIDHGAHFTEVVGDHHEQFAIATLSEDDVFDHQKFAAVHSHDGQWEVQAFAIALGVAKKHIFEMVIAAGGTQEEAALQTAALVAFNVAVTKLLKDDALEVGLVYKD